MALENGAARDLVRMTPSYWHLDDPGLERSAGLDGARVTVSAALLRFRPRSPRAGPEP